MNSPNIPPHFDLFQAVLEGNCERARRVLVHHPDVTKYSALLEAVKADNQEIFDLIVSHFNPGDMKALYEEGELILDAAIDQNNVCMFNAIFAVVNPLELDEAVFHSAIRSPNSVFFERLRPHLPHQLTNGVERAVEYGNVKALKSLLDTYGFFSTITFFKAIEHTCRQEMLDLIVPYADANILNNGLSYAVEHQHDVLEQLLKVCDPKSNRSHALQTAVVLGFWEIADMLAPLSEPQIVLDFLMESDEPYYNQAIVWLEQWIAHDLNTRLHESVEHVAAVKTVRKM